MRNGLVKRGTVTEPGFQWPVPPAESCCPATEEAGSQRTLISCVLKNGSDSKLSEGWNEEPTARRHEVDRDALPRASSQERIELEGLAALKGFKHREGGLGYANDLVVGNGSRFTLANSRRESLPDAFVPLILPRA